MSRFFLGFAIGTVLGAAAVLLTARTGDDERAGLALAGGARGLLDGAMQAGRAAASAREQELREDFRARLKDGARSAAPDRRFDPLAGL
jgi:hypothetical protein